MAQELWLIRHAESSMNLQPGTVNGRMNEIPLTEKGEGQAHSLGIYLAGQAVDQYRVYVSKAVRAQNTAAIALTAAGIQNPTLVVCDGLQEMDQGEWTGQIRDIIMPPEVRDRMAIEGIKAKAPGGESMYDVAMRKDAELRAIVAADGEQDLPKLVFGHGVAIRSFIGSIKGWDRPRIYGEKTDNTSITKVILDNEQWHHDYDTDFNLTPHFDRV